MDFCRSVSRCKTTAAALLGLALLGSCAVTSETPDREVNIKFDARLGEQPLRCGVSYQGVGRTGATAMLQDFRIYISNVRLLGRDGREHPVRLTSDAIWQSDRVALLDFEDSSGNCNGNRQTNTSIVGHAPPGDFVGLAFEIGVPADLNHQDTTLAEPPLNFSALTWPWRFGYKFTTIDLDTGGMAAPASTAHHGASGFSVHLGSVDCGSGSPQMEPETPCAVPNRASYRLDKFDAAHDVVVLDLGALLAASDITVNAPGSASGCMSAKTDDDCVPIMDRLGLAFRGVESHGQRFVRTARER